MPVATAFRNYRTISKKRINLFHKPILRYVYNTSTHSNKFLHVQADPNELDQEEGILPINEASSRGFSEIVRILLAYGASVYVSDPFENTTLIAAASNGHLDCIQLLHSHFLPINILQRLWLYSPRHGCIAKSLRCGRVSPHRCCSNRDRT